MTDSALPFGSLLTAMVTPFAPDLSLDESGLIRLAEHLVQSGSDSLVAVGTTGESPTLSFAEKIRVFQILKAHDFGKPVPIIAGTGSYATRETITLSQAAQEVGVDGLLIVNPYYNKPSQEGLYQHFKTVAESVSLPMILYNHPGRTGVCLSAETVSRLAQIKNIVGIKDSSGDLGLLTEIRAALPEFIIYSGDDPLTLPILAIGGQGVISVASHVAGQAIKEMIAAFQAGKIAEASTLHRQIYPLMKILFCAPSPAPTKAALESLGIQTGGVRLPLTPVTAEEKACILDVLNHTLRSLQDR